MPHTYEKPALHRFGTFRQLTQFGPDGGSDIGSISGIGGCSTENNGNEFGCTVGGSR